MYPRIFRTIPYILLPSILVDALLGFGLSLPPLGRPPFCDRVTEDNRAGNNPGSGNNKPKKKNTGNQVLFIRIIRNIPEADDNTYNLPDQSENIQLPRYNPEGMEVIYFIKITID